MQRRDGLMGIVVLMAMWLLLAPQVSAAQPAEEGDEAFEGADAGLGGTEPSAEIAPAPKALAEDPASIEGDPIDRGETEEEIDLLSGDLEENLLAPGRDPEAEDPRGELDDEAASFGASLEGFGLEAEISGYGETVFYLDGDKLTFDNWHFVPIIGVQIGQNARAEIELEFEHGGDEQKVEYAFFEYTPYRALALRVGKFNVPFGYFNAVLHPSFRWNQINRPAMMTNVVPATWNEVGAQIYGRAELGPTSSFEYNLWITNGLGYDEGSDLSSKSAFVRKFMRENNRDNNIDKAVGGRLGLRVLAAEGAVRIISGFSFYTSAVDPLGDERLSIVDWDVWVQAGNFMIRGEVAHSFWTTSADAAIAPLERGSYLQLAYALGRWTFATRWDNTFVKPGMGRVELHNTIVPTLMYAPDPLWSIRAEVALPLDEAYDRVPRTDLMISFSF